MRLKESLQQWQLSAFGSKSSIGASCLDLLLSSSGSFWKQSLTSNTSWLSSELHWWCSACLCSSSNWIALKIMPSYKKFSVVSGYSTPSTTNICWLLVILTMEIMKMVHRLISAISCSLSPLSWLKLRSWICSLLSWAIPLQRSWNRRSNSVFRRSFRSWVTTQP